MNSKIAATAAGSWLTSLTLTLVAGAGRSRRRSVDDDDHDRGDVPGWVMITVMTAIVVIALLAVFREQVVTAVQNAFESVSGARLIRLSTSDSDGCSTGTAATAVRRSPNSPWSWCCC